MPAARPHPLPGLLAWFARERPQVLAHGKRVAALMEMLAEELGLPPAERERWRLGGLLHDLGKAWVPRRLLQADRRLSPRERQCLARHPEAGAALLQRWLAPELAAPLLPFLLLHHERPDGRGYPFGLKGSGLPLEVALLSVADAYAAMRERRPYAAPRSEQAARSELQAGAGEQFHPRAVALFLRALGPAASRPSPAP